MSEKVKVFEVSWKLSAVSNLHLCEPKYETLKKWACLIFYAFLFCGGDAASAADTKSNRCQGRWNMYGPPNGQSGDDISKHTAQWMFTQCEKNWSRFKKRSRNQKLATKINLLREAGGESESGLEILAADQEGLKCNNNYDVGMLFILGVMDTLEAQFYSDPASDRGGVIFPGFWNHHIKVPRFFLSWRWLMILVFFPNLLDSIPVLFLLFLHFWSILFRKSSKSFECLAGCSHLCLMSVP